MAHLVTGHAGKEHIMPSDDGAFNAGVVGTGKYVLDIGNKFSCEIVSNNLVKIADGELVNQGRHMNIPVNNYEEVTIENGLQAVKRNDLICMRYTKNADTSIESAEVVVVKGTSSTNPTDPVCEEGNILEGALVDDFPLYRVRLDGLNIEGVDCLFDTIPSLEVVNAKADANAEAIQENATDIATINDLLTTKTGTVTWKITTGSTSNAAIYKWGKLVTFSTQFSIPAGTDIASTTVLLNIPEGFRPGTNVIFNICGVNDKNAYSALINGNGNLYTTNAPLTAGVWYNISAAYIAK